MTPFRRVLWQIALEDAASLWTLTLGVTPQGEAGLRASQGGALRLDLCAATVEEVLALAAAAPELPAALYHALHDDLDLLFTAPHPWTPPD